MKKLLIATFAVIISMFLCFPVALSARAASLAKVTFNDAASRKGESIEIIVNLSGCQKIKSMAVVPLYDSGRLEYISGEWLIGGALLSDWDQDEQNGVILYSSETDVNGDIAKFVFQLTNNDSWDDIDFSCKVVIKNGNSTIGVEVDSLKISIICDHEWNDEILTKNSTCTEEGYTYKLCSICKRENRLTDIEKIAHNASDWIIDKESTINEEGLKYKECTVCKEVIAEVVIPQLGQCNHIFGDEVFIQEATCSESGMVYNICEICDNKNVLIEIEKLVHVSTDWIVDEVATIEVDGVRHKECVICKEITEEEVITKLDTCNHIWGEEVFIQEATCSEVGIAYTVCQLCEEKNELIEIEKTTHFLSDWIVDKEPTTEEEGECHKECLNCGAVLEKYNIPCLVKQGMEPWVVAVISISAGIGGGLIVLGICFFVFLKRKKSK